MLSDGQFSRLCGELSEATKSGRLQWQETADENTFRANFKQGSVRISHETAYNESGEEFDYVFNILNKNGKVADEYLPGPVNLSQLKSLYGDARRSARGADSVIDSIFKELDADF